MPLLAIAGVLLVLVRAIVPGWATPLWLDESFTGAIATAPNLSALIDWCLHELSGPVYYGFIWVWAQIFGASDFSLRLPSLLFAVLAPLVILRWGHAERDVRITWALLVGLWLPGSFYASEARPYALLILLAVLQAITFVRLIDSGGRHRAIMWAVISAAMVLTHFHATIITGIQGLLYLVLRRREAARTWSAALVFVPVGGWMWLHLPFLLAFAEPDVAWYNPISSGALVQPGFWIAVWGGMFVTLLLLALVFDAIRRLMTTGFAFDGERALVASAIVASAIVIILAILRPSFAPRYLIPFLPALLFGVATMLVRVRGQVRHLLTIVCSVSIIVAVADLRTSWDQRREDFRHHYSLEAASTWLADAHVKRLAFFWDSSTAAISTPQRLGEMGSFFLRRDGWRGTVTVPRFTRDFAKANTALVALAPNPGDGILFLNVTGRFDKPHPLIYGTDRSLECRDFGSGNPVILACIRRPVQAARTRSAT
jgi:hypothetical protein